MDLSIVVAVDKEDTPLQRLLWSLVNSPIKIQYEVIVYNNCLAEEEACINSLRCFGSKIWWKYLYGDNEWVMDGGQVGGVVRGDYVMPIHAGVIFSKNDVNKAWDGKCGYLRSYIMPPSILRVIDNYGFNLPKNIHEVLEKNTNNLWIQPKEEYLENQPFEWTRKIKTKLLIDPEYDIASPFHQDYFNKSLGNINV